jgi:hypothetical protein
LQNRNKRFINCHRATIYPTPSLGAQKVHPALQ